MSPMIYPLANPGLLPYNYHENKKCLSQGEVFVCD